MKKQNLFKKFKEINNQAQRDILKNVGNILELQKENSELKKTIKDLIIKTKGVMFSLDEAMKMKKQWQNEEKRGLIQPDNSDILVKKEVVGTQNSKNPTTNEETLSSKRMRYIDSIDKIETYDFFKEKDVKQFMKEILDMRDLDKYQGYSNIEKMINKIKKRAGKELVK